MENIEIIKCSILARKIKKRLNEATFELWIKRNSTCNSNVSSIELNRKRRMIEKCLTKSQLDYIKKHH